MRPRHRHPGRYISKTPRGRYAHKRRPIHDFSPGRYKPKQPKSIDSIPEGDYISQEKKDGVRTNFVDYGNYGRFINRRGADKTKQYPEFQDLAKQIPGKNIIDGEVVAYNKKGKDDFKLLSERDHLKYKKDIDEKAKKIPLTFEAFDILNFDGTDIRNLPWKERNKLLKSIGNKKRFQVIKSYPKAKAKELMKDKSVEGVVFKKVDSVYDNKKDDSWLKLKQQNEAHLVVTAFKEGEGKRKGMIGALYGGVYKNGKIKEITKIGTGFSNKEGTRLFKELKKDKTRKEDGKILVKPKKFIAVNYLKRGSAGALREPVYKGERPDLSRLKETHL